MTTLNGSIADLVLSKQERETPTKLDEFLDSLPAEVRKELLSVMADKRFQSRAIWKTINEDFGFQVGEATVRTYRHKLLNRSDLVGDDG